MSNAVLIWDLPVRLFHWLLAAGFVAAATVSLLLGEHGPWFPLHAIIGLSLGPMVVLRLFWGVFGTRHAQFSSFAFGPRSVATYARDIVLGGGRRYAGHNPGSAWAIFSMLGLMLALCVTGVMLGMGREWVKEVHEACAYAMVAVVGLHVAGVAVHTVRHREPIAWSMIHGRKHAPSTEAIDSTRPVVAAIFLLVTAAWTVELVRRYDPATGTTKLPLLGTNLHLSEREGDGTGGDHDRDDDD